MVFTHIKSGWGIPSNRQFYIRLQQRAWVTWMLWVMEAQEDLGKRACIPLGLFSNALNIYNTYPQASIAGGRFHTPLKHSFHFKMQSALPQAFALLVSSSMDLNLSLHKSQMFSCGYAEYSTRKRREDIEMSNRILKVNQKRSNCILFESPSKKALKCNCEIKAN